MPLSESIFRTLYHLAIVAGRPIGGLRPRRLYDWLGRHACHAPNFVAFRNAWGHALRLSHFYHIDRNILIYRTYDRPLHHALVSLIRPGFVCFDVGANLGEMALHMASLARPTGRVYAFEPAPPAFQRLCEHVQMNGFDEVIRCEAIALSDTSGRCKLAFADRDQDNQGLGSIIDTGAKPGSQRVEVPTFTLDEYVERRSIERLDLMKIDIQGAEYRLLQGGRRTLERLAPDLLMEISPADLACVGKNSVDLCRLLADLGYTLHALTRHGDIGSVIPLETVTPTFEAVNVYCTRRTPA